MPWHAVFTQPYAEPLARREIEAQGVGTFLPHFRVGRWRGSELRVTDKPLLPGYVFISLPDGAAWSSINHADGVTRVLLDGEAPARIPDGDVAALMLAHATGAYDVIEPRRDATGRYRRRKRRRRPRHGRVHTGPA